LKQNLRYDAGEDAAHGPHVDGVVVVLEVDKQFGRLEVP